MTSKYQIRFTDRRGCGSFKYFDATYEDKETEACKIANEFLRIRRERDELMKNSFFHQPHVPIKTVSVVEYDNIKKCTKRGGYKFKISLRFFEITFKGGGKKRDEWYEPNTY